MHATGGRGARGRILRAAGQLFYERGIHATGVAALVEAAHVSTRTFYQQFGSKSALVEEYLRQFDADGALESERQLSREDLPPAQRLLAIFDTLEEALRAPAVVRGCPFHNAAVEAAGEMPEVARLTEQHKQAFRDRLAAVGRRRRRDRLRTAARRDLRGSHRAGRLMQRPARRRRRACRGRHPAQGSPPKAR